MTAIERLLTYDSFTKYLKEKGYREIEPGVFVLNEEGEEVELLVVRKGDKYKEAVSSLKKELEEHTYIVESREGRKEYGILFVDNYVVFMRRVMEGLTPKIEVLKKSLDRITPAFKKKFNEWLRDPSDWDNWEKLFDRSDVVEEFYLLFSKARENLLKNIRGLTDDEAREEFADTLMMQLLIVWYLQEKGFLDGNQKYLVERFEDYKKYGFNSFYEFLKCLFKKMSDTQINGSSSCDNVNLGDIIVTGPAPFLESIGKYDNVEIPDDVFYKEGQTEILKRKDPRRISDPAEVPILNLFESRDWTEGGEIDNIVLGSIFEKLMTKDLQKGTGAYYTPKEITEYIAKETVEPYLLDKINEKFKTEYKSLDEFFEECKRMVQEGKKTKCEERLRFLFNTMRNIKILDPACGSGHFLERAVEVLVEIYERIRDIVRDFDLNRDGFTILATDENGNLKTINLLDIEDEDEFKMNLKFYIIVSRNIYGVDINKRAVEIARARLFISIAEHFRRGKRYVRFPNVHFNLRQGNSLIGFIDVSPFEKIIKKAEKKQIQLTLEGFFNKPKVKPLEEKRRTRIGYLGFYDSIKNKPELRKYFENMDKKLGTKVMELAERILEYRDRALSRDIVLDVLKFKSELNKVLLVSLNSDVALEIAELIEDINRVFDRYLTEELINYLRSKGGEVTLEALENPQTEKELREGKKLGHFHWILEFPEVFFEFDDAGEGKYRGFDIVIGNPPYGEINKIIKDRDTAILASKIYRELYKHQNDGRKVNIYKVFLERTSQLIREGGYFGMIFPSPFLNDSTSVSLRRSMFEDYTVKKILEFPEKTGVFRGSGVTQAVCIVTYAKRKSNDYEFELRANIRKYEMKNLSSLAFIKIKKSALAKLTLNEYVIPLVTSPKEWEILEFLAKFDKVNSLNPIVKQGDINETKDKEFLSDTPDTPKVLLVKGIHFDRFFVNLDPNGPKPRWVKNFTKLKQKYPNVPQQMKEERLGWREVVNKAQIPRLKFSLVPKNVVLTHTINFMVINGIGPLSIKYLLALLNSHLLDWFFQKFSASNHVTMPEIRRLPIVVPSQNEKKVLETIADYLTFLRYMEYENEREKLFKEVFEQFDKVKDYIVYELYFRDVLYPKPRTPLLDAVSGLLKEIEFDKWIDLYHKKQLGELTDEKEFQELTERNVETIKEVYNALKENSEVEQLENAINQHEWVKMIEARFSKNNNQG